MRSLRGSTFWENNLAMDVDKFRQIGADLQSPYCISGEHANFFGEINILCEGKWRCVGGTGQIGVVEAEYLAGFCN